MAPDHRIQFGYTAYMGNRVKELRLAQGLSQEQLAERCNTSKTQISRLERGSRRMTFDWAYRLAGALRCTASDLLDTDFSALTPAEQSLVGLFRGLSPEDRAKFLKVAHALAEPSADRKDGSNGS